LTTMSGSCSRAWGGRSVRKAARLAATGSKLALGHRLRVCSVELRRGPGTKATEGLDLTASSLRKQTTPSGQDGGCAVALGRDLALDAEMLSDRPDLGSDVVDLLGDAL
jgi:hypothetical protein